VSQVKQYRINKKIKLKIKVEGKTCAEDSQDLFSLVDNSAGPRMKYTTYHKKFVFVHPLIAVRVEHVKGNPEAGMGF
jgi:hypothetical protein